MKRKSFSKLTCPIARSLEHVGDWWNIMILRDAAYGLSHFDHFQQSLGITPGILTRRLNQLVKAGLMKRRRYLSRPPRYEYVLTEAGDGFRQVLLALMAFGSAFFGSEEKGALVVDRKTRRPARLALIDRESGVQLDLADAGFASGPATGEISRLRIALSDGEISADEFISQLSILRMREGGRRKAKSR
jgi:DNA-binding HxlR family transcriptional regulator